MIMEDNPETPPDPIIVDNPEWSLNVTKAVKADEVSG